jgi:hypothetical protein
MKSNSAHKLEVRHEHGGVTERYGSCGNGTNRDKRDIKSTWLLGPQTCGTWKISGNQGTPYAVCFPFFFFTKPLHIHKPSIFLIQGKIR